MLRIGIIAGEVSGDLLGAGLMRSVLAMNPDVKFEGIAGEAMQEAGCDTWFPSDNLAVMGLTEVLKDLPRLLSIKKQVVSRWMQNPPDLFIGIDAPDFNLRVARQLKNAGIHTMHYVSPSVWAWRAGRIKTIEKAVNDLFCLLPFEPEYFKNTTVKAHFVGHPKADVIEINSNVTRSDISQAPAIAVLPGSRNSELQKLAIPFLQSIGLIAERFPLAKFSIPLAKKSFESNLRTLANQHAPHANIEMLYGQTDNILANSDIALVASGTATLETMLHACPMVVAYRMAASTVWFLKITKSLKTRYFSLPNILADKELVPEILQNDVTPARLSSEIISLLEHPEKNQTMRNEFNRLHKILKQNTNQRVAELVMQQLTKSDEKD